MPTAVLLFVIAKTFDKGASYETYKDQIAIANGQVAFGDTKSVSTVAVMGTIKNASPIPWKEIRFHADFTDAAGKTADVGQKEEYSFYLPPNAASSFKVSFHREFAETNYVKHNIRVVAAKDARARW